MKSSFWWSNLTELFLYSTTNRQTYSVVWFRGLLSYIFVIMSWAQWLKQNIVHRCWGLDPGPHRCKACALPLSHIPWFIPPIELSLCATFRNSFKIKAQCLMSVLNESKLSVLYLFFVFFVHVCVFWALMADIWKALDRVLICKRDSRGFHSARNSRW